MRAEAFAQDGKITFLDKFGRSLSSRMIKKAVGISKDKVILDIGCGYDVGMTYPALSDAKTIIAIDVDINPELELKNPNIRSIRKYLPEALDEIENSSVDILVANNILEHLNDPVETLNIALKKCKPETTFFINVPSWRGKFFLELAAFKFGMAPFSEMDDHKVYYSKNELWKLLVDAGLKPHQIKIKSHKFGLNTMATRSSIISK